ncbi:B1 protein-like [Musca domestica]|uniref:B1 protein-like n=1 Tax=Musca domestica TaxID=7370 RepID=A0ABM3URE2_MUSDO|nr:B1 protein-like [Musca domestica]
MNKLSFVFLICAIAMISADRPDWYPEDEAAVEAKCREENNVSAETVTKTWANEVEDTPELRKFLLCLSENKHLYHADTGFKADRLQYVLKEKSKLNCKDDFVEGCVNAAKDVKPDEALVFDVTKCVVAGAKEHCEKVE